MLQFLNNLWRLFIFSNYTEIDYVKLDLLKMSDTANAGPSENFLIVDHPKEDHNEWEFKRLIIGRTLNQLEKSCKTREVSYKWSTIKYNSINTWLSQNILRNNSSIQMWSTSKDWKTGGPKLKIEDQIMAYRWTFGKDNLNLEKFCERCTVKYDIIDYGVMMDLQKKSFIETGESCPHWLKITLWKELDCEIDLIGRNSIFYRILSWSLCHSSNWSIEIIWLSKTWSPY